MVLSRNSYLETNEVKVSLRKTYLAILVILTVLLPTVLASEIFCQNPITPLINCTMVSPVLNCTTYDIINTTSLITNNANLTLINKSIYYFNFTEPTGNYIVKFCDNTTRQAIVGDTGDMGSFLFVAIMMGLFTTILSIALFLSKSYPLKATLLLGLTAIIDFFVFFAWQFFNIAYPTQTALINVFSTGYIVSTIFLEVVMIIVLMYLTIYGIINFPRLWKNKKGDDPFE